MENERDVFSDGWSDESIVSDGREREALPGQAGEGEERAPVPGGPSPAAEGGIDREIRRFVRAFPDVRGEDITREVWERVRGGQSLTEAYLLGERARLRAENDRLRADRDRREYNLARSAGSQTGEGSGGVRRDAFEEGWEMG